VSSVEARTLIDEAVKLRRRLQQAFPDNARWQARLQLAEDLAARIKDM
jgi:hypothetical protein